MRKSVFVLWVEVADVPIVKYIRFIYILIVGAGINGEVMSNICSVRKNLLQNNCKYFGLA